MPLPQITWKQSVFFFIYLVIKSFFLTKVTENCCFFWLKSPRTVVFSHLQKDSTTHLNCHYKIHLDVSLAFPWLFVQWTIWGGDDHLFNELFGAVMIICSMSYLGRWWLFVQWTIWGCDDYLFNEPFGAVILVMQCISNDQYRNAQCMRFIFPQIRHTNLPLLLVYSNSSKWK